MKQTFDTDKILFLLLKNDAAIAAEITGGVYRMSRPLNSELEDIVVNTIVLSQEFYPQIGTSNVNIHVKDMSANIGGVKQQMPNTERLAELSEFVLTSLRGANIQGLTISVENQTTLAETQINQHFVNIRINWNIHS